MTSVALVFRTIGERTSDLAYELAVASLRPEEIYVLANTRPFTETVRQMLEIDFKAEQIVAVDADSLIFDDMRSWIEKNREPYVDCYVFDRFRGRIHCGVHITRRDVMLEMRNVPPSTSDHAYVLRPESRLRRIALNNLGLPKGFKSFRIFHDHFQWLRDIWAKYALRELRSRTFESRRKLEAALARWAASDVPEFEVAIAAVRWAQTNLPEDTPPEVLNEAIARFPEIAAEQLSKLGIPERGPLTKDEVDSFVAAHDLAFPPWKQPFRVFGLGLSRTGTRSLTAALHVLGIDTIHYPIDEGSLKSMTSGRLDFPVLDAFDGITDITVAPYYAQLDRMYPDAKFVLTLRDEESWLASCREHWSGRDPFAAPSTPADVTHMEVRRFLRAAVYGTYEFEPERFRYVYRKHADDVRRYFAGKPGKLVELDIVGGDGWEKLCPFLGRPVPDQPFPHKGGMATAKLMAEIGDPDD